MNDEIISLDEFMQRSRRREHYIGYVVGLGYVSAWKMGRITLEHPVNNSAAHVGNGQFILPVDTPVVIDRLPMLYSQNNEYTEKGRVAGWGGIAATAGTIMNKALLMEPRQIRVNPQGTVMKNPNYGNIKVGTKGVAGGLGWGLIGLSIVYDWKALGNGEITEKEMWVDIAINGTIFLVSLYCPLLGVVLGITYMMGNLGNYGYIGNSASYEKIHGSITPPDNTRVVIPQKELPILLPNRQVIPPREQPAIIIKPAKK
ncbi:MAG: hypothetical protein LBL07_04790 [Tannerella sp.]|jgi:hypothetical protein|nr:hypothetical protein [Tannerella sp.]